MLLSVCVSFVFTVVKRTFLDKWEASVAARKGFEKINKAKMLLSEATRIGLRLTGIHNYYEHDIIDCPNLSHAVLSFVDLVEFIFTIPGVTVFCSNRICQDQLENFLGQQRQRGRVNENPNIPEFIKNTQALRIVNTTCCTVRGNCRGAKK